MKELYHGSGGWLKKKSIEHLAKTLPYGAVFFFLLLISSPRLPTHIVPPDFDNSVTLLSFLPATYVYVSLREYLSCKRGMEGKRRVKQLLNSEFGAGYNIINDAEYVYDEKRTSRPT